MNFIVEGASYKCVFARLYIFELWCTGNGTNAQKLRKLIEVVQANIENNGYIAEFSELSKRIGYICKRIVTFWRNYKRKKTSVVQYQSDWLNKKDTILLSCAHKVSQPTPKSAARGRPKIDFMKSSKRTKRRKIAELSKSDESIAAILRSYSSSHAMLTEVNVDEVLSLLVETNMSKHQYMLIRSFINSKTCCSLLPSYEKLLTAKASSYPEKISVSESQAEVELQNLLDHTAKRILKLQGDVLGCIGDNKLYNLILIGKWGFDGSTGHSKYIQKPLNNNIDDSCLFVTSYVPLQLITQANDPKNHKIIWKNPRPSSTRYCRPIRFQFEKETTQLALKEEKYFKEKITLLKPTTCDVANKKIEIEHSLQLTMVDGKICSALSQTSTSKCYICDAKPTEMNDLEKCLEKKVHKAHYEFGLSPLHSYIRFFEYFLHLSYRLELKNWRISAPDAKKALLDRKTQIQADFRAKMGLIVDKPRTGGSGTSNNGNTARTFFRNTKLSAEITGLDENVLIRCSTLLQCMASGYKINVEKFGNYALDTAKELIKLYPWYYLPPSVHKVLVHAPEIISYALVTIGELSEEAAESKIKDIKKFREQHTRKMSRKATNTDLLNRLLLSSDPYITGQRKLPSTQKTKLLSSAFHLLLDD